MYYLKQMAQLPAKRHVLADIRMQCGLTQRKLAKILDVALITIQRIEQGTLGLSEELAAKAQDELDVAAGWLLANDPSTAPVTSRNTLWNSELYEFAQGSRTSAKEDDVDGMKISIRSRVGGIAKGNDDEFIAWRVAQYTRIIHAMLEATRGLPKQGILIHRLNKAFTALAEDFDQDQAILEKHGPTVERLKKAFSRSSQENSTAEKKELWRKR
jgi:transcriptional regulator with XRE-family HTH domain